MLSEKYRPKDWADIVGQDEICQQFMQWEEAGQLRGRAFFISGKSGTGKTSLARIIRDKVSDQFYSAEMDASELTTATLKRIKEELQFAPMTCQARVFIVNEAHG